MWFLRFYWALKESLVLISRVSLKQNLLWSCFMKISDKNLWCQTNWTDTHRWLHWNMVDTFSTVKDSYTLYSYLRTACTLECCCCILIRVYRLSKSHWFWWFLRYSHIFRWLWFSWRCSWRVHRFWRRGWSNGWWCTCRRQWRRCRLGSWACRRDKFWRQSHRIGLKSTWNIFRWSWKCYQYTHKCH